MKRPYKQFDIPSQHLTGDRHYVPPKARTRDEIDWRRAHPAGTVLAEQEYRGLLIAAKILGQIEDEPDAAYATNLLAVSGINSTWYNLARRRDVMRSPVRLPEVGANEQISLLDDYSLLERARLTVDNAVLSAQGLMRAIKSREPAQTRKAVILGRTLGEASLTLACVPNGEQARQTPPFIAQAWAREQGLGVLQQARSMALDLGTHPSIAQLADPNSDLAMEIRRHAPNTVELAYDEALAMHAMPR